MKLQLALVETVVQADGTFTSPEVVRSEYRLSSVSLPQGYYIVEATQRGRNVLAGGLFPGDGDLQITLADNGAALSGLVSAEDGKPMLDATVFVVPDDGGAPLHAQTDEDGKYSFTSAVRPGRYRVAAVAAVPDGLRDDFDTGPGAVKRGHEVLLGAGQIEALDLKLSQ